MILEFLIVLIYALCLLIVLLFAITQVILFYKFKWARNLFAKNQLPPLSPKDDLPRVTIQLPIYNEQNVIQALIKQVVAIEYPKDRLEIQVLDDSTDDTSSMVGALVSKLNAQGIPITHIHRKHRTGFKAGALKEGLAIAKGEFIAIFDADFLPQSDWLLRSMPYFKDPKIGVVQTRWGHLNRDHSILTRVQAFALDLHFGLEQIGRQAHGVFMNFNGTAGIWRKSCIEASGNWSGTTLTEDLDLSYRAQLRGWRILYRPDIITPAQLPQSVQAARSQQFRWNKGGAQNFRQLWHILWAKKDFSLKEKIFGTAHLFSSSIFFLVLILIVLSIPLLWIKNSHPQWAWIFYLFQFFGLTTLLLLWSYTGAYKLFNTQRKLSWGQALFDFFVFFTLAIGLSANNAIAVIQGHLGVITPFVRTPKFNTLNPKRGDGVKTRANYSAGGQIAPMTLELFLMLYALFGLFLATKMGAAGDFGLAPFHILCILGFGYLLIKSIFDGFKK
ncbi:glycosyltransferase family 2 protein [Flavobacteriaceae bacterium]|nr:glycosyltransferase family 2 protein [Flavobacteriaceae bacterium]